MASNYSLHTHLRAFAKAMLWNAQGGKCHICGNALRHSYHSPLVTFDHVWPAARASAPDLFTGNTLLAHKQCNAEKADRKPKPCELLTLYAVNRRLGLPEVQTRYWDRVDGSAL